MNNGFQCDLYLLKGKMHKNVHFLIKVVKIHERLVIILRCFIFRLFMLFEKKHIQKCCISLLNTLDFILEG